MEFTHVSSRPNFPSVPPEQMEPENNFNYELWSDYETVVTLCNCPWGTSEIQVGLTSIGGLGKVVKFADNAARDAYFDGLQGKLELTTPYRGFSQTSFQVGCPFDVAMQYNYLYLDYNPAAPLAGYDGVNGHRRIYYFIRDVVYRSPSNTELVLQLDYWTTFVNSVEVTHIGLERGHYPLAKVTPQAFLSSPRDKCKLLSAPDIVGNSGNKKRKTKAHVDLRSGSQWALLVSTSSLSLSIADPTAIKSSYFYTFTSPALYACAVPVNQLDALMRAIDYNIPTYFTTIQGVYILDESWFTRNTGTFDVDGVTVYNVTPAPGSIVDSIELNKADFPVSATRYGLISKLYTWPYSWVEVTDYRGNVTQIRVEDIDLGTLAVEAVLSLAAPFIQLTACVLGCGGSRQTLTIKSISQSSYISDGESDLLLWSWDIPCYQLQQAPTEYYLSQNQYPREQKADVAATAKSNADASALTAKTNADASAGTAKGNANRSAKAAKKNVEDVNAATTETNRLMRVMLELDRIDANQTAQQINTTQETYMRAAYQRQIGWMQASTTLTDMYAAASANLGVAQNAAQGIASGALQGAIAGGTLGPAGAGVGAVGGAAGAAVGAAVSAVFVDQSNALMFANDASLMQIEEVYIQGNGEAAITNMKDLTSLNIQHQDTHLALASNLNEDQTRESVDASNAAALNTKNTNDTNATKTYETATGNALNTYNNAIAINTANKLLADNALMRELQQAQLNAPYVAGGYSGEGANAATKPTGLMFAVCSQSEGDLATAGESFLRYGVYLNQWVELDDWQLMSKFTYWKAYDLITEQTDLPDAFVDRIKGLLIGGISVYSSPDDILTATPYNNGL